MVGADGAGDAAAKYIAPAGVLEGVFVVNHSLCAPAKLDGVAPVGPDRVIIVLIRIPDVKVVRTRVGAPEKVGDPALNRQAWRGLPGYGVQVSRISRQGIDRIRGKLVFNIVAVETDARGIHEIGAERVVFFQGKCRSAGAGYRANIVETVRLRIICR